jgi:hypothetical protein
MALTKFNFNSFDLTTAASTGIAFNASANGFTTAEGGALNLITTNTISSGVSSSSFTSGIDSTYDTYLFKFINIHPASDGDNFQFQGSTNGGSSFGVTITSTAFRAYHDEADNNTGVIYEGDFDLAQSTSYLHLNREVGGDNDQCQSGSLYLFSPSSTTFVKHFVFNGSRIQQNDFNSSNFVAGYFNTTSAINALDFKMASGNIDSGVIKMYGLSK